MKKKGQYIKKLFFGFVFVFFFLLCFGFFEKIRKNIKNQVITMIKTTKEKKKKKQLE
jgi:hypothetical protein